MGTFTKGDVVLFPFPYTDLTNRKLRPCLVLSNQIRDDIILCQITSQKIQKDSFSIELLESDIKEGSLHINSYIRPNMLFTSSVHQIVQKIGIIRNTKYKMVMQKIIHIIQK